MDLCRSAPPPNSKQGTETCALSEACGQYPESGTAGTKITIKAVPNEGYDFVSWDEGPALDSASDNARNSFILEGDVTLSATFAHKPVTITIRNAEGSWPMNPSTQAQDLKLYCTSANIASFRSSDIYNSWNNTWSGCPLAEFTP